MHDFPLPDVLEGLVTARNFLRHHYQSANLKFQFDGNLVGDIGEAVAAELYGIKLLPAGGTGIDGIAPDGRSVQVKATGTGRGPAFRHVERRADVLLFFAFDFERLKGTVVFNGPEDIALKWLPAAWVGQRSLTAQQIAAADSNVPAHERLPLFSKPPQA